MFTGIVEGTGEVRERTETGDGLRLRVAADWLDVPERGASVSVAGCCLTVEDRGEDWFETFLATETRAVTYLGDLTVGDAVNLERAMPADGRFDGHLVQGHVDDTTAVAAIEREGEDWRYAFELPDDARYLVSKGSITVDGISLTVASIDESAGAFEAAIVPETHALTALSEKTVGDPVHLEYDVIAKYVESLT